MKKLPPHIWRQGLRLNPSVVMRQALKRNMVRSQNEATLVARALVVGTRPSDATRGKVWAGSFAGRNEKLEISR